MHTRIERDHVRFTIKGIPDGTSMRSLKQIKQIIEKQGLVLYCVYEYDPLTSSISFEVTHRWVEIEKIHKSIGEIHQFVEDYLEAE
jgi:hypothetical protein